MPGLTLDAGAFVVVERNHTMFRSLLLELRQRTGTVTVPAAVLAQVWRGPRSIEVAMLIRSAYIEQLDDNLAKRVGELLGRSRTADVVDAAVAVGAGARGDIVLTSDPGDLERLRPFAIGSFRVQAIQTGVLLTSARREPYGFVHN